MRVPGAKFRTKEKHHFQPKGDLTKVIKAGEKAGSTKTCGLFHVVLHIYSINYIYIHTQTQLVVIYLLQKLDGVYAQPGERITAGRWNAACKKAQVNLIILQLISPNKRCFCKPRVVLQRDVTDKPCHWYFPAWNKGSNAQNTLLFVQPLRTMGFTALSPWLRWVLSPAQVLPRLKVTLDAVVGQQFHGK